MILFLLIFITSIAMVFGAEAAVKIFLESDVKYAFGTRLPLELESPISRLKRTIILNSSPNFGEKEVS